MKIMAIADTESKALWNHYDQNRLDGTDLIVSCGDLDPRYLTYLVTLSNLPLLYVRGNHDDDYKQMPPEGCIDIDGQIYVQNGIRFLGLGGSYPYKRGDNMYSEAQMRRRIAKLKYQLRKYHGFDILVTHAPAHGLGDCDDFAHHGYEAFLPLLEKYKPSYMIHGHVHMQYDYTLKRENHYQSTTIINAYEKYFLEI